MKRLDRITSHTLPYTVAVAFVTCFAGQADAFTLSGSSGAWSDVIGGAQVHFATVGNENQVRWGIPLASGGNQPSGLGFTGVGEIVFAPEEIFQIGTLRHFNNGINNPASGVTLAIDLDFGEPDFEANFSFDLQIDETPNNAGTCVYPSTVPCADRISFADAFASETFEIDNIFYMLEIVGFSHSLGGDLVTDFISQEGGTNSASLFARVTTSSIDPPPVTDVPEPAAIAGLVAIAGLLSFYRRRNR